MARREKTEQFLRVPYVVLKSKKAKLGAKILYCHIYSFGRKGCFQTNDQLARILGVDSRTISRWIKCLKKLNALIFIFPNNPERVLWAKDHPKVFRAKTTFADVIVGPLHIERLGTNVSRTEVHP